MNEALNHLRDARDYLDCYKYEPGTKGHGAYYCVLKAINALEKEKFIFPDNKDRGITLRDYFAGQALASFGPFSTFDEIFNKNEVMAKKAYKFADAMLAEREKEAAET